MASKAFDKKKTMAFLVGYVGSKFSGSTFQPQHRTVEGCLVEAFRQSKLITEANALPTKISFKRSSRTDKGTHASANLFSARMNVREFVERNGAQALVPIVQQHFDVNEVRIFGAVPVSRAYVSRGKVTSRKYKYVLPRSVMGNASVDDLDQVMSGYVGTHHWHNFVKQIVVDANDDAVDFKRSAELFRTIFSCRVSPLDGYPNHLAISISGNSFVYHQIRKMVSLALMVLSGQAPQNAVALALNVGSRVRIPTVPSCGLVLSGTDLDVTPQVRDLLKETEKERQHFEGNVVFRHIIEKDFEELVPLARGSDEKVKPWELYVEDMQRCHNDWDMLQSQWSRVKRF